MARGQSTLGALLFLLVLPVEAGAASNAKIEVSINKAKAADLFSMARHNFQDSFAPKQIRKLIAPIADGKGDKVTPQQIKKLSSLRKDGNVLRSLFYSLDARHQPPESLERMAATFGKLNDALSAKAPEAAQKQAQKLRHELGKGELAKLRHDIKGYRPASRASFDRFVRKTFDHLQVALDHDTVLAPELHGFRKEMRNLMNVCRFANQRSPDPGLVKAYGELNTLNDELGAIHDGLVRDGLNGKIDYDHAQVKVPEDLRAAIRRVMSSFHND